MGDDASPGCDCGYADGVYFYCVCVGMQTECKTWDDDDEGDDEDNDDEGDDEEDGSEDSDNLDEDEERD